MDEIRTLQGCVQTPGDEIELLSSPSFSYFHILFYDVKNVKTHNGIKNIYRSENRWLLNETTEDVGMKRRANATDHQNQDNR